jgi:hypothetical protein
MATIKEAFPSPANYPKQEQVTGSRAGNAMTFLEAAADAPGTGLAAGDQMGWLPHHHPPGKTAVACAYGRSPGGLHDLLGWIRAAVPALAIGAR